ncbi:MAG TPA: dipeptidase [Azospirillaceae bacterium]|nr:dipeptidase [Azospirillaceae bacterium]
MNQMSDRAQRLYGDALVWDMTMPHEGTGVRPALKAGALDRLVACGYGCVSLSVCGDLSPLEEVVRVLARERAYLRRHADKYALVGTADEVLAARRAGKLAVFFQFQGTDPLGREPGMVEAYYQLGVRMMLLAYNQKNAVGDGCYERTDGGLSRYGQTIIREMERVGMLLDLSHTGYRTTLDALEMATRPVVFSHSNAHAVRPHPRNIRDDQIRGCARTGGVIGINGVSSFLTPENDCSTTFILRHIDHVAQLVGPAHVGIGLDWLVDPDSALDLFAAHPDTWPEEDFEDPDRYAAPEQMLEIAEGLLALGYADDDVRGILGGNWLRVCREVWR